MIGSKKKFLPRIVIHQIKEVKGNEVKTKCGKTVTKMYATVWWREVTCERCGSGNQR